MEFLQCFFSLPGLIRVTLCEHKCKGNMNAFVNNLVFRLWERQLEIQMSDEAYLLISFMEYVFPPQPCSLNLRELYRLVIDLSYHHVTYFYTLIISGQIEGLGV